MSTEDSINKDNSKMADSNIMPVIENSGGQSSNINTDSKVDKIPEKMEDVLPPPDQPGNITPAFIMASEIGKIDGYKLGMKINESLSDGNGKVGAFVDGIQEVRSLWRIYMFTYKDKVDLCNEGLTIGNRHIKVFMSNPFATGAISTGVDNIENVRMVKLIIRDLYKSVAMKDVTHMLTDVYKVTLATDVKFAQYRDEDGQLTTMNNFDRYVWVHPDQLKVPLPRNAQCGVHRCRIFYKGQFKPSKKCYNCHQEGHLGRNCTNPKACKLCLLSGHEPGDPKCTYYTTHHHMKVFGGKEDPMSNHYESEFMHNNIPLLTSENGWFYGKGMKNGQSELALKCLEAKSGAEAKYLSHGIRCTEDWDNHKIAYDLMKDINRSKFQQVKEARNALHECWQMGLEIVESVPTNQYCTWGSGLTKEATLHTRKEGWYGDNMLGKILTELAVEFWGPYPSIDDGWDSDQTGIDSSNENVNDSEPEYVSSVQDPEKEMLAQAKIVQNVSKFIDSQRYLSRGQISGRSRGRGGRGGSGLNRSSRTNTKTPQKSSPRSSSVKRGQSSPLDLENAHKVAKHGETLIQKAKFTTDGDNKVK